MRKALGPKTQGWEVRQLAIGPFARAPSYPPPLGTTKTQNKLIKYLFGNNPNSEENQKENCARPTASIVRCPTVQRRLINLDCTASDFMNLVWISIFHILACDRRVQPCDKAPLLLPEGDSSGSSIFYKYYYLKTMSNHELHAFCWRCSGVRIRGYINQQRNAYRKWFFR